MEKGLILSQVIWVDSEYKGSSKFPFWNNIEPRHILEVSFKVMDPGRNGKKLYASSLTITNLDTEEKFNCSITDMVKYLSKLDYVIADTDLRNHFK